MQDLRYGDYDNINKDIKTLQDILSRQGSKLLIDVIAEHVGQVALTFNFTAIERFRVLDYNVEELKEAILERI